MLLNYFTHYKSRLQIPIYIVDFLFSFLEEELLILVINIGVEIVM